VAAKPSFAMSSELFASRNSPMTSHPRYPEASLKETVLWGSPGPAPLVSARPTVLCC
jgi:hypothetical protein